MESRQDNDENYLRNLHQQVNNLWLLFNQYNDRYDDPAFASDLLAALQNILAQVQQRLETQYPPYDVRPADSYFAYRGLRSELQSCIDKVQSFQKANWISDEDIRQVRKHIQESQNYLSYFLSHTTQSGAKASNTTQSGAKGAQKSNDSLSRETTENLEESLPLPADEQDLPLYEPQAQPWYPTGRYIYNHIGPDKGREYINSVDVVILVVNNHELDAVLHLLKPLPKQRRIYRTHIGTETYYLGRYGLYCTAVSRCRMGSVGPGSAAHATPRAIALWQPKALIMVGIAFGANRKKHKIADVLVATQIIPYEPQRVGQRREQRGEPLSTNPTLLNRFCNAPGWHFSRPDGREVIVDDGPILSGEKLVDEEEFKAELIDRYPTSIGGEMEGAGLSGAASMEGTPWILVKAICDWADGTKTDRHQPLAAAAAASLVEHVLKHKGALDGLKKSTGQK